MSKDLDLNKGEDHTNGQTFPPSEILQSKFQAFWNIIDIFQAWALRDL